ncbi:hypothetical protein MFIFM68171_04309 [Madurella fahalii]|uniref:Uncharacterized protein n=1 Tax=Madurella fahalii TaxID=1157608 RepID=A0ABQ0G8W5_9PEZI
MARHAHKDIRRGPWTQLEDQQLRDAVHLVQLEAAHQRRDQTWVRISTEIVKTRTPKQCRERWEQNLKPGLRHDPITAEEGDEILRLHNKLGNKWAKIAQHLPGRSDNAVKNWFNGYKNRLERQNRMVRSAHRQYQHERTDMMALQQPLPSLPPTRDSCHYGMRSPLSSPTAISPVSQPDRSPISDSGSHYAATPLPYESRRPALPSLCLLPVPAEGSLYSPPPSASPTEAKFPPVASLFSPNLATGACQGSGYYSTPRTYLPTAPTSPVRPAPMTIPSEPSVLQYREEERRRQERVGRLSITSLLNE